MEKNEGIKAEIRKAAKEMLLGVKVTKMVLDSEGDGYGEMLVDTLIEELRKLNPQKVQAVHCQNESRCDDTKVTAGSAKPVASGNKYIGTKLVSAMPAWRVTTEDGRKFVRLKSDNSDFAGKIEDGYRVVYEDGYESWSPREVFERAYRRTDGMSFGLAIEAARMGKKIARAGWNGKHQYVELATNISYRNACGEAVNAEHKAIGSAALAFVGTSGVQLGWLASQADMLADDWYIAE